MKLRLITASVLAALVVVPTAGAEPQPTRATPPPDAFERAVPSAVDWQTPDAFMRYLRNHPHGTAVDHPDGFAGVAAAVPRTASSSTEGEDGRLPSPLVPVSVAGAALLGLGLLLYGRVRRLRTAKGGAWIATLAVSILGVL